jgi:mannose-6-phosphate isomerase-like protein (cupin superfamily)
MIQAFEDKLWLYVMGLLSPEEALEIDHRIHDDPAIRADVESMQKTYWRFVQLYQRRPTFGARGRLLNRLDELEADPAPPILHSASKVEDYAKWLPQARERLDKKTGEFRCVRIAQTEDTETFLVSMETEIPSETHEDEIERLLIVQGACSFQVADRNYHMVTGDFFRIPLHQDHSAQTTSSGPCIFLLQRTKVS